MTASEVLKQMKSLPTEDRARIVEETVRDLGAEERRSIERMLRRLQHPDVPESFWQGVEDHEDGRTVEMETIFREVIECP